MVTDNHYRWDFIQLSTDTKPTPATSPKVVDGSTLYTSDNSKLYVWYKDRWYEKTATGGGGGGGSYTAGDGIDITNDVISVDTTTIQPKLTAGSNITISDDTISATDTTYSNFTGTDGTSAGASGLVPAPATTDAGKFLKADGTWDTAGGGSGPTVVQTTGTSTTDVMSQNAVTSMIYQDPGNKYNIRIGDTSHYGDYGVCIGSNAAGGGAYSIAIGSLSNTYNGTQAIAIGLASKARANSAIAIGNNAQCTDGEYGSISLGAYSGATRAGEMNIGASNANYGFNSSNYRLLSGVYDGQSAHDAVTVGQVNGVIDAINTALSTNIPHIGA